MSAWILEREPAIRLAAFLGIFATVAVWEWLRPRRARVVSKSVRWLNNLGLVACNTAVVRVLFPAGAVGISLYAETRAWGVFNQIECPEALSIALSLLILDLAIYLQHVLFHRVPALWRLHLVHHADRDFDVTTGARFHPFEIVLSMVFKAGLVIALGAPAIAVIVFEVVLNATAMFNHGNLTLPGRIDHALRWLIVTPDMHRIHHSELREETDSNFGFNLPWWDRLFGTYRAQPGLGQTDMIIGLPGQEPKRTVWLPWLLLLPFFGKSRR